MSRHHKIMTIFRLAVILGFFWNLSLGRCWVGTHPAKTVGLPIHSTTLFAATTKSTEPTTPSTARIALVFPSSKERFRNLTRAIEYSVVHDEYEEDDEIPENYIVDSNEYLVNGTLGEPIGDGCPTSDAMTVNPLPRTRASKRSILSSVSLWLYWFASKTKARLGKLVLRLRKKGSANLGGTKRHYALLLASFVQGTQACLLFDPGAYHRAIVESAHHRTVASLSPLALEGIHHVSALEGHALKWTLRKRRQHQKQHG
mmetsp:Transcript_12795/g.32246  ORF Transcript_12795/g.32246 Transcript_12795/m.32246 type:complete len:258 (+) Transcript_12795:57-830(+)